MNVYRPPQSCRRRSVIIHALSDVPPLYTIRPTVERTMDISIAYRTSVFQAFQCITSHRLPTDVLSVDNEDCVDFLVCLASPPDPPNEFKVKSCIPTFKNRYFEKTAVDKTFSERYHSIFYRIRRRRRKTMK